ncbi:hypothetical protein HMPREF9318_02078 [Streptococcus urinalis FB127-CNA-2]|uniref:Oxidoreductase, short chain dehydrogenase/reductase family protein n=1 Tax=Streptococcus urinalis 2285-97 TaxID=764291 RepID=G5KCF9_9STRE|nr:3-oxoacyl-ACP reductase [Streptococcus urinalis]EHJ56557.1 oxidoreductase, short chain dehydrogenase/reductase family protein [Streptococcus urinalis 2285-97]EKS17201.1 hypothetical protein HMPREF9318_02078 [Streptococcus urinalis FB127-CNA-2]VEF32549.1 3-ketoacyl-ACP reductase [Streptococcus urinalis]
MTLKKALVTGVASGIGKSQAIQLAQNGFDVYGVDKNPVLDLPDAIHFLQLDLNHNLSILFEWLPEVSVLCNTAGILDEYKPLLEMPFTDFENMMSTNVYTVFKTIQYYLPKMISKQEGIIINMCSIASFLAGGGGAAYTTSKHALAGLTKQIALDYAADGIQVFGIAPGAVRTGMTASDFEPGGLAEWVADQTPIKRWIMPDEIAELTLFLASGKASALQGEIIKVDGGWSLK